MTVYISGSISKDKDYLEKFERAERQLWADGFDVVNPADVMGAFPKSMEYVDYMATSIRLLDKCDAIYMLRDWQSSHGARIEYEFALGTNKNIMYESEDCK